MVPPRLLGAFAVVVIMVPASSASSDLDQRGLWRWGRPSSGSLRKCRGTGRCPLWVHFRTSANVTAMSAFPPMATKLRTSREVRFVPACDIARRTGWPAIVQGRLLIRKTRLDAGSETFAEAEALAQANPVAYLARFQTSTAEPPDEVRATPNFSSSGETLIIDQFWSVSSQFRNELRST